MTHTRLPFGKLPLDMLSKILAKQPAADSRVAVGPGVGLDNAVIDFGDRYLVAKTDPITFATDLIGWYAVHVNANDIACSGAAPRWFMGTLLVPRHHAEEQWISGVFDQLTEACQSIGASLVGGHTEITHGIDRPILVGTMFGEVDKEQLIVGSGAQPGDVIIQVGGIPIEATAILAREKAEQLSASFDQRTIERSQDFLFDPGISIVQAAQLATEIGGVHAMHDPTEGGLAAGLWELAHASGCQLQIDREAVIVLPEGEAMCAAFDLDPLASIASGALLICADPNQESKLHKAMAEHGIPSASLGAVVAAKTAAVTTGQGMELSLPERDEIARLFD
jgi:hydrogenase maturation factor